jgi:tetratricopeptide (TPR) repeat protein
MKLNSKQIAVIVGSIALIVLLLFANTKLPRKEDAAQVPSAEATTPATNINQLVEEAKSTLAPELKQQFENLEQSLNQTSNKRVVFERIVSKWDSLRQPAIAAYYIEQAAFATNNDYDWKSAGDRYYASIRFVKEEAVHQLLYAKAIECFEKAVELNPKNIEAKISLASCYVDGSPNPMKGIGLLREIEKTDSNNVNLQLSFAFFSEKSGQWDKAIARFHKVLKIQPDFIEAYLHLADAYERKGDKEKAIENLEKYSALVDDFSIKAEVQNYIKNLKTN